MTPDATVILALKLSHGIGNVSINRLTAWARAADRPLDSLIALPIQELLTLLPQPLAQNARILADCSEGLRARASDLLQRFEFAGGHILLQSDNDYPASLQAGLADATPPILFVTGDLEVLHGDCAAVAGSRTPSATGDYLAQACARTFVEENITVVSGGAAGVDTTAHATALEAGGRTVVVLPEGSLSYRGPRDLLRGIDDGRVALVSEFTPDVRWSTPQALTRNATLVALSRVACVIEPKATGGSIRTAQHVLDQGKPLLTYTKPEHADVMKRLERKGAQELSGEGTDFDRGQLLDAWAEAAKSPASQSELF